MQLMTMERGIQSFELPLPTPQPLPRGPRLFPPLMLAAVAVLTVAGKVLGRRRDRGGSAQKD